MISLDSSAWELKFEKSGVKHFSAPNNTSPISFVKVESDSQADASQLVSCIFDAERKSEWFFGFYDFIQIDQGGHQMIEYMKFRTPPLVKTRDFVLQHEVIEAGDKILINLKSIEHPEAPKTIGIRARANTAGYELTPHASGTYIRAFWDIDPGGRIPGMVANFINQELPYRLIKGLCHQAEKPDIVPYQLGEKNESVAAQAG